MKPRKTSAITIFSFQSASATATIAMTTIVETAAFRATSPIAARFSPKWRVRQTAQDWLARRRNRAGDARVLGRAGLLRRAPARRRPGAPAFPVGRAGG